MAGAERPKRHERWQQQRSRSPPRGHRSHLHSIPPALLPAPGWQHPKPTGAQLPEGVAPEKVLPRASAAATRPTQEVPRDPTLLPWRPKGPRALPTLGTFRPGPPAQAPRRLQSLGVSFWFKGCFIQTLHRLQQRCGHKNTQNKTVLYLQGEGFFKLFCTAERKPSKSIYQDSIFEPLITLPLEPAHAALTQSYRPACLAISGK